MSRKHISDGVYLQLGDEQFLGATGVEDSGFSSALVGFGFGCR